MNAWFVSALLCTLLAVMPAMVKGEDAQISSSDRQESSKNSVDEIMVILGKVPRPIDDVFGAASVISRETINQELAHDIADLVRYQAGISIESSGTRFGLSGFKIRGIGGNRVATEIDGVPVADQFDIGRFSNSGRNFIDIDLVQQVEILRGPASSTYGSNAIGGVVSFITKKPIDLLAKTNEDFYVGLKAGYYGVDNSRLLSLNTAFARGTSSGLVTLSHSKGHDLDNNAKADIPSDQQDFITQSVLAKYYLDISDDQQLSASFDYFNRASDTDVNAVLGLGRFRNTTSLSGDDESKRYALAVSYEFVSKSRWLEGGVIRAYHQRTETEQLTDEERFSRGTNFKFDRDFFYQQQINGLRLNFYTNVEAYSLYHRIGYGVELSSREITESRNGLQTNLDLNTSTNTILGEEFPVRDFPISKVTEFGVYLNDEVELKGTSFSLIPALRFDSYRLNPAPDKLFLEDNPATTIVNVKDINLSPKLGLQYEINNKSRWFLQYFEGFRAPPFEDANIGLDIPLFNIRAIANPDLKSESSKGLEVGYKLSTLQHNLSVVGFHTKYNDFIQTKVNLGFDPIAERVIFQSQNIDSAKIYGGEFLYSFTTESGLTHADKIKAYVNLFWSKGENMESGQPLNNIDPNHALLGINWLSPDQKLSFALHASLYSAKKDIDELDDPEQILFRTPGYGVVDLILNYKFNERTTLSVAAYNIGNRRYWRWSNVNGLLVGDPTINSLTASGINGSIQLRIHW